MRTSTFTTTITPIRGFTTTSAALNCIVYVVLALLLLCNYNRVAVVESFLPSVLQRQTTSSFITSNKAPFWFVVGKKMKKASNGIPMLFERRRQLQEQLAASSSSSSASSSTTTTGDTTSTSSCDNNINQWSDSITEYLNTNYYSDLLVTMAMAFTEIGTIAARKNAFSGGSYKVLNATISNIEDDTINLDVYVQIRSEKMPTLTKASFSLGKIFDTEFWRCLFLHRTVLWKHFTHTNSHKSLSLSLIFILCAIKQMQIPYYKSTNLLFPGY